MRTKFSLGNMNGNQLGRHRCRRTIILRRVLRKQGVGLNELTQDTILWWASAKYNEPTGFTTLAGRWPSLLCSIIYIYIYIYTHTHTHTHSSLNCLRPDTVVLSVHWRLSHRCNRVDRFPWTRRFVAWQVVTDPETLHIKAARSFETSGITNCTTVCCTLGCAWHCVACWITTYPTSQRPSQTAAVRLCTQQTTLPGYKWCPLWRSKDVTKVIPFYGTHLLWFQEHSYQKTPPSANGGDTRHQATPAVHTKSANYGQTFVDGRP